MLDISDFVGFLHCFPSVRGESAGEGLDSWMNHGSRMPDPSPIRLVDLDDSWVVQKHAHLCISLHDVGLVRREPNRLHENSALAKSNMEELQNDILSNLLLCQRTPFPSWTMVSCHDPMYSIGTLPSSHPIR